MNLTVRIGILAVFIQFLALAEAGLIDNSPFIPPGFQPDDTQNPGDAAATGGPLSSQVNFRGYYKLDNTYYFLLSKKGSPDGEWVTLGERGNSNDEFQIHQFDEKGEKVEISYNMSRGWIDLSTDVTFLSGTTVGNAGSSPARSTSTPSRAMPSGGTRSVVPNRPFPSSLTSQGATTSAQRTFTPGRSASFGASPSVRDILGGQATRTTPGRRSNELDLQDMPVPQSQGSLTIPNLPDKPPTEAPTEAPQIVRPGG